MSHEVRWRSAAPLDLAAATDRYRRWGDDAVNVVDEDGYWRVAAGPTGAPYCARQEADGEVVVTAPDRDGAAIAVADLRYRLAEGLPRRHVEQLAHRDAVIGRLLDRFAGYRPPLVPDPFEALVGFVTAQQVNLTWATTTRRRVVERFGRRVDFAGRQLWQFPRVEDVAGVDPAALRTLQLTWVKARAIVGIAAYGANGGLADLGELPDGEVIDRIVALHGVGRWTADWFLARCLGRPGAVAAGDLGVRKAVGLHYLGLDRPADAAEVREVAATWGTGANWAAHLLLEALQDS